MNIESNGSNKKIRLMPGEHYVSDSDVIITTILGSCVSACLYDPVNGIVGMNHFMLSGEKYNRALPLQFTEAGRYGVNAMELIINGMLKLGAEKAHLQAKIFGGASLISQAPSSDSFTSVGAINSRFVLEFLKNDGIKITASSLGGNEGRIIHFNSKYFSVYLKRIKKSIAPTIIDREKSLWKQQAIKHYQEPELWR